MKGLTKYKKKWHSTNRYDASRYISKYYTVTNGSAAFETLQAPIPQYYSILYLYTKTNQVFDFIALNYTSMTNCVGIY